MSDDEQTPVTREEMAMAIDPHAFDETVKKSTRNVAAIQWAVRRKWALDAADAILAEFTVLHPVHVTVPPTDLRPHSRACGIRKHEHGRECHSNCPTCGGSGVPTEHVKLDPEPWEYFDGKRRPQPLNQESGNPYGVLWSFKPRPGYSQYPADYPKGTP